MKNKFYKIIKLSLFLYIGIIFASFFILNVTFAQEGCTDGSTSEGCTNQPGDSEWVDINGSDYNPGSTGTGTVDFHTTEPTKPKNLASDTKYELLAPFSDQLTIFDTNAKCPFGRYANIMITIFLGICAVLAMIMIIMGGIEYMTSELISSKEAGKEKITHAVLGLLLALGAWLILNTINPNILNLCLDKVVPLEIEFESEDVPHEAIDGMYCSNPSYPAQTMIDNKLVDTPWDNKISSTIPALPANVSVSSSSGQGECRTVGQSGCTSIRGLDTYIINTITQNCADCTITITGGTECWEHSRNTHHKPGSSTVDLRFSTKLDEYIEKKGKFLQNNKKGEPMYIQHGIIYVKEADHWHANK